MFSILKAGSNKPTNKGCSSLSAERSGHIVSPQNNLISLSVVVYSYCAKFLHCTSATNFVAYIPGTKRTG